MGIYKVIIKTEGNETIYRVGATTLATIAYRADINKWAIITLSGRLLLADTEDEAHEITRKGITAHFASLGVTPEFVSK